MPELPEVEVVRRKLTRRVQGRPIRAVLTTRDSHFFATRPRTLKNGLVGRRITSLYRAGKYLLARLDDGQRLVLHLGMTGQLFTASPGRQGSTPDRHTHLRIEFADAGPELWFRDARKFGRVLLLGPDESSPRLDRLGTDALTASGEVLFAATRGRKACIKNLLLDQSVLAGIGNIYADEALHRAGIRPTRRAGTLSRRSCQALVEAVGKAMLESIRAGGTTVSDYVTADRRRGSYQNRLRVYDRAGEACLACGRPIRRVVLGGRSAHYCPRCQK
jgi:formamidopyrimidine-DNA glycosylase